MPSRKCPLCGVAVKLENLERHVANVHPKQEPALVVSAADRRVIREKRMNPSPGLHVRRSTLIIAVAIPLLLGGIIVAYPYLPTGGGGPIHWHPQLRITIDGNAVTIPANIGIDPSLWRDHSLDEYSMMQDMPDGMQGMAPLHTHDTLGTIHVESRVSRDYTLGEFFRIWGQSFDGRQVLGHAAPPGHSVWMVVDGAEVPPSYSLVLRDGMHIEIVCGLR